MNFFWTHQFGLFVPGTSWNKGSENRETTGDRFLGNPCLKAVFSTHHSSNFNDSEQEETHHMVTRVQEEIHNRHHLDTGFQEDIRYCSLETSSGKQKKARSTSQPQFRSENTPATIEADQSLSAVGEQQLRQVEQWQKQNLETAQIHRNDNAQRWREIREDLTVRWFISNEFRDPQSTHGRRQNILIPLSHACWCVTVIQKHHQPQKREFGRNFDCVP